MVLSRALMVWLEAEADHDGHILYARWARTRWDNRRACMRMVMRSRRASSDFDQQYPSAWQRHRDRACTPPCRYCVEHNKLRGLSWRFIPSDQYAAYRVARQREASAKKQQREQRKAEQASAHIADVKMIVEPFTRRST